MSPHPATMLTARRMVLIGAALLPALVLLALFAPPHVVVGQVSYVSLSTPYTQNFDTLNNTGPSNPFTNNVTLEGWYSNRTVYIADEGTLSTGGLHSYGSSGSSERALGSVGSGSAATVLYGVRIHNDTGFILAGFAITYTGEQWRSGLVTNTLEFAYQTGSVITDVNSGTWTGVTELNFVGPVTATSAGPLNGNLSANQRILNQVIAATVAPGEEIMFRWKDIDNTGSDQGLAIDDLTILAIPLAPDLAVSKSGPNDVVPGNIVNYTLDLSNNGLLTATSTVLTDVLPSEATFLTYTTGLEVMSFTESPVGTLVWQLGDVPSQTTGLSITVQALITTNVSVATWITNNVIVSTIITEANLSNNVAYKTTRIGRADLTVNKNGPPVVMPGDRVTYTIRVDNVGITPTTDLIVTDTLVSGMTFVTDTTGVAYANPSIGVYVWNLPGISAGEAYTFYLTCDIGSLSFGTILTNTVDVATSSVEESTANNQAQLVSSVGGPDLVVGKEAPSSAAPGDVISFTLRVWNVGSIAANNVWLTDTLPGKVAYASDSLGYTSQSGQDYGWSLGALDPGPGITFTVNVTVSASAYGGDVLVNTAQVSEAELDQDQANNITTTTTTILGADPYVVKSGPDLLFGGEVATYTIVYGNQGTQSANVTITDTLPLSFTVADIAADGSGLPVALNTGNTRAWTATVAAGDRLTFTLALTVPASIANNTRVTNTVDIATAVAGNDPADDQARAGAPVYQIVPISTARAGSNGQIFGIEGRVTVIPLTFGTNEWELQDGSGGISAFYSPPPSVALGDHVRLVATRGAFNNQEQMATPVYYFANLGSGPQVAPLPYTTGAVAAGSSEGWLVVVTGTVSGLGACSGNYQFNVDDGSGAAVIFIDQDTGINVCNMGWSNGDLVSVIGFSTQYQTTFEIKPRMTSDMWRRSTGLHISKSAPSTIIHDSPFTYALIARNDTDGSLTNVLITDSLPISVSVGAISDGGVALPGNIVSWTIGSLAQGASVTRTVAVTAPGSLAVLVNSDYGISASEYVTRVKGLPVTTRVVLRDCSICQVQGSGDTSPYVGQVVSVTGVIYDKIRTKSSSGTDYYGFFMQAKSGTEDGDPATSDGLFVYLNTATTIGAYTPAVGDEIVITGTVDEYYGLTELKNPALAVNLGQVPDLNTAVPPTELKPLDEATADNAYRETLESMRVVVPEESLIVAPTHLYASTSDTEFYVIRGDHPVALRANPFERRVWRDGEALDWGTSTDGNSYRISVEANVLKGNANDYNAQMPRANVYDVVTSTLVGPLYYAYSRYTLMVENTPAISATVDASTNNPPQAPDRSRQYSMATMNMENLYDYLNDPADGCDFLGDPGCPGVTPPFNYIPANLAAYQTHLAKLAQEVIAAQSPDILAVEEAEDQDVCAAGGEVYGKCSITSTIYADGQLDVLQDLAQEIYIRSGSVISYQTAADRAGVDYRGIIVGYLFRADRVELAAVATLSADPVLGLRPTDPYTYTHNRLVLNPKALQATASVAAQADGQGFDLFERLPQAALFRVHRLSLADPDFVEVYAIGNHFKSTPDSYVQRRTEQANYNDQLAADILAAKPNARVAVLGDLNVYPDSVQLAGLYTRMSNLHYQIPAASRYSYTFDGQTQTLDQIFVTSALSRTLAAVRAAHVNADWSYDHDTISTTIHAASDHDPIVATFGLPIVNVSKSVTPNANVVVGSLVTYTIVLSNSGDAPATSVVLTDALPAGVDFGNWLHQGSAILPPPGRTLTWGPYTLQNGDSFTLSFTAIVTTNPAYYGAAVVNTAECTFAEGSDSGSASFAIAAAPAMGIAKSVTPSANVLPGGTVTYTVVMSNSGGSPANNALLTDVLPSGVDFGAWVQQGAATLTGRTLTWGPGTLSSGSNVMLSFTGIVTTNPAYLGAVITNTAQYASANAGSGSRAAGFAVASAPALATSTKTSSAAGQIKHGDQVTYTITLINTGGTNAAVRITDTLMSAYTVLNRMSFTEAPTGTLTWQGNVPAGQSVTLQFAVQVVSFTRLPIGRTTLNNSATVDDGVHAPFFLTAPTPPWVEMYGLYLPYAAKN